ncbi:MAG: SEC-C domain-containing protein [Deltaproteobacteria bacterium]|nr:SEC-C domain-containing protein [Deltaproteobacteria bacterium]
MPGGRVPHRFFPNLPEKLVSEGATTLLLRNLYKSYGNGFHERNHQGNSAMVVGRNAPCPCGSGKKYKKCCLAKRDETSAVELHYRRLSKAHDRLVDRLMALGRDAFGQAATMAAVDEFWGWPESDEDLEPTEERLERTAPLFWPWFIFSWYYDPEDIEETLDCPVNRTVAEFYADQRGPAIDSLEAKIITAFTKKPYSFYEVMAVNPGKSLELKDVLTGFKVAVQEHMGSEYLKPADIIFGRAVTVDGVGMLVGLGTTIIPPRFKPDLINLRNRLREGRKPLTDEHLYDWDLEIRRFYLDLEEHLHTPPQLANTDGDPLEFHKLVYDIDSAEYAFEKMASLCVTDTKAELRKSATVDASGLIQRVEIVWNRKGFQGQKGVDNTLLGRIRIDKKSMTIEVNSAGRAKKIQRSVSRRLGRSARFKVDQIQDPGTMMAATGPSFAEPAVGMKPEDLMHLPEVQTQLASLIGQHWDGWVDEKLPALGGKTPRQAVRTADGREAVEALLADFERGSGGADPMAEFNQQGIQRIRKTLGL